MAQFVNTNLFCGSMDLANIISEILCQDWWSMLGDWWPMVIVVCRGESCMSFSIIFRWQHWATALFMKCLLNQWENVPAVHQRLAIQAVTPPSTGDRPTQQGTSHPSPRTRLTWQPCLRRHAPPAGHVLKTKDPTQAHIPSVLNNRKPARRLSYCLTSKQYRLSKMQLV